MNKKISKALLLMLTLLFVLGMTSCMFLSSYLDSSASTDDMKPDKNEGLQISSVDINNDGELIITYTNGSVQNLGSVVGKDGSVNVDINGNSNDASFAVANGLRSAVSIQCVHNVYNKYGSLSTSASAGSGVIYKIEKEASSAFIITNYHVVYNENAVNKNGIVPTVNKINKLIDKKTLSKWELALLCMDCGRVIYDTIETGSEFQSMLQRIV